MNMVRSKVRKIDQLSAHHYKRFSEVLFASGRGMWLYDCHGIGYLDMLSTYSAVGVGNNHPRIKNVLRQELPMLGHTHYTVQEASFLQRLTEVTQMESALLMNTGAEAVETAIKLARKWAYTRKHVKRDRAEIVVAKGNFHGRTTTIISFSTSPESYESFGPHTPGFKVVPYGDAKALKRAITKNTAAVLLEPIQGEGGVIVPPSDYLKEAREICDKKNVLLMLDEIQTGFGRTGKMFCFEHAGIKPDVLIVGKALGGGAYPVSAVLSSRHIMDIFQPGEHGSTFGGNAFACAVAKEAIDVIEDEGLVENSAKMGELLRNEISLLNSPFIKEVRGRGLLIGVEFIPDVGNVDDEVCKQLLRHRVIAKGAHETVLRLAPPLIIEKEHIEFFFYSFRQALYALERSNKERK